MIKQLLSLLLTCFYICGVEAAEIKKTINDETKLVGWEISENNFQLELIQRSPIQTRSFFQARGFSKEIANDIATQCVFQTIVRNTQEQNTEDSITVSLKDWQLLKASDSTISTVKLKETWVKEWQNTKISSAARIAFRWATFPSDQTFEPGGDFNWGMISFGLQPDKKFDLHVFWKQGTKLYDAWIKNMQCPSDTPE